MAHAIVDGRKHLVRVTRDLVENWAVELYPDPEPGKRKVSEPYKPWPVPLTVKVRADTLEDALACVLEQLKRSGKISEFHVEEHEKPKPPPPAPPKPAPVAAAVKPAAVPGAAVTAAAPAAPAEKPAPASAAATAEASGPAKAPAA
jgi:hypothetical protein